MKITGAVLLLASCVVIGCLRLQALKRRKETLSAMSNSLQLIKSELDARLTTLPALMCFLAEQSRGETKSFYESIDASMDELGECEFSSIWTRAARQRLTSLSAEEQNEVIHLGQMLGQSDVDAQLSAIARCQTFMDKSLDTLRGEYPQLCRLAFAVPAAAGLMIVIVLI